MERNKSHCTGVRTFSSRTSPSTNHSLQRPCTLRSHLLIGNLPLPHQHQIPAFLDFFEFVVAVAFVAQGDAVNALLAEFAV